MASTSRSSTGRRNSSDRSTIGQLGGTAKDKPFTTAAAAAGAVAAGVFLWSRRNQISDQISRLSNQITDWADEMRSGSSSRELAMTEGPNESSAIEASRSTPSRSGGTRSSASRSSSSRSTSSRGNGSGGSTGRTAGAGMSETGGGNASLGAHSGTTGTGAGS